MNTAAKILPLASANAEEELTRLRRRIGELGARDIALLKRQILAEKTSGGEGNYHSSDLAQAEAILHGEKFVPSREKPVSHLAALREEREVVGRAIKLGNARLDQLETARAVAIWASYQDEISQIEMLRVTLALQLQRTNQQREQLREKIIARGGAGVFHSDGVDLLGLGDPQDDIQWAVARLIADGVCSRREIEKASSNG